MYHIPLDRVWLEIRVGLPMQGGVNFLWAGLTCVEGPCQNFGVEISELRQYRVELYPMSKLRVFILLPISV